MTMNLMMMNQICFKLIQAIFLILLLLQVELISAEARCIERERRALLDLKAGLVDRYDILSSWGSAEDKLDCCQWNRVRCSNQTGHIQVLDLHGDIEQPEVLDLHGDFGQPAFGGKIHKSLTEFQQLKYLNLSSNYFSEGNQIPEFFGSLRNLRYLDLSRCDFRGKIPSQLGTLSHLKHLNLGWNFFEGSIPYQLGNLSNLRYLDLSLYSSATIPSQLGVQWLSNLTSLTHLDLRGVLAELNHHDSHNWLQIIGKLPNLRELRLSSCRLSDEFIPSLSPSKFNFSTSLVLLDLSHNTFSSSRIFQWVSNVSSNLVELDLRLNRLEDPVPIDYGTVMSSLERLDLSYNEIKDRFLKSFMNLCTLRSLVLCANYFTEDLQSILHNLSIGCVRYSLQELDLRSNQFTGTLPGLSMFLSLKALDLSGNLLNGKIPEIIILPPQLESLSIGDNSLEGGIPKSFGNTCTLRSLDLSLNKLDEDLAVIIHHLSGCARYSLQELYLGGNQIKGTLPDFSIFPSLKELYLSQNRLNGKIAEDIQFPPPLEVLYIDSNSLEGVISDSHFANLSKLKHLDLSDNSLALTFSQNWVPSFQLDSIKLRSCKLGPNFPKWLLAQNNFTELDISNAGISDITPGRFWALLTKLSWMNISYNNLTGTIPNLPFRFCATSIFMSTNQFEGPIPAFLRRAVSLDLSKNKFSDSSLFLCPNDTVKILVWLDISNNQLFGQIPDCWSHFKSLGYLDLSNNNLSGNIPPSMGSLLELQVLILRNNRLSGLLPLSLRNCTMLVMIDAGENKLSGLIPSWIGSRLQQLQMLSLQKNQFFGILPLSLCYLTSIQVLDLSVNNLSGRIPRCFKNFTAMAQESISIDAIVNGTNEGWQYDFHALLMWKGTERMFDISNLRLESIDLSANQLSGEIPIEIMDLVGLVSLNLSRNKISGEIPPTIGQLKSLDSLDLSSNQLSGRIPSQFSQLGFLGVLNLSYNNLSGEIPYVTKLLSFDASYYMGNPELCGAPLPKCPMKQTDLHDANDKDEIHNFIPGFYISMIIGFFAGFWGVCGSLVLKKSWRYAYFKFFDDMYDKLYVLSALSMANLRRRIKMKTTFCD